MGRKAVSAVLAAGLVSAGGPALAQSAQEVKDGVAMMVGSAALCGDYLGKPDVLDTIRATALTALEEAGWSAAQATAEIDALVEKAKAETPDESRQKVACEMINIRAID